jgi:hypothetical protein
MDNIVTPKKKRLKCQHKTPSKIFNFLLTPQKNRRDQRMPTGLTQKRLWGHLSENFVLGGGGGGGGGGWTLSQSTSYISSLEI